MSAGKGQKGRGEEGIRGWDGWMASPMQWTWTWANFRRRWGTGRSAVLQFMGSPRVGHDWVTEQQQQSFISSWKTRIYPSSICWVSTRCHIYIHTHIYMCMLSCFSHVLLFATLWTVTCMFLCPWDTPGKNTRVGCHVLLQEIFLTQGWNPCLLCVLHCRHILYC